MFNSEAENVEGVHHVYGHRVEITVGADVAEKDVLKFLRPYSSNKRDLRVVRNEQIIEAAQSMTITDAPIVNSFEELLALKEVPLEFEFEGCMWSQGSSSGYTGNLFVSRDEYCAIGYSTRDRKKNNHIKVKLEAKGWVARAIRVVYEY